MAPSKTASSKYVKLNPREHCLARPGMYIGSVERDVLDAVWTCNPEGDFVIGPVDPFVSGLYKIFDEMVVNVLDHVVRSKEAGDTPVKEIRVTVNSDEGYVEVFNGGPGIEVLMHDEHQVYVPELIFGNMHTSTNYDDQEERTIGGQNGIGAKACNIFSTRFDLETVDKTRGLKYVQSFSNNMSERTDPVITKVRRSPYTKVRFYPDLKRFHLTRLEPSVVSLMRRRVHDMCALTPPETKVYYNDALIECKTFERYVDRFVGASRTETPRVHLSSEDGRWELVVCESANGFQHMSFVNGLWTAKGGKHVEYVTNQLTKKLSDLVKTRRKIEVRPSQIRECLFVFLRSVIPNPTFDSQLKDNLTTPYSKFGSKFEVDPKTMDKVYKLGMVDRLVEMTSAVEERLSKKTDGKKRSSVRGIPKLDDANWAGTARSDQCTLILTEGDSAKTMAISGLSEVGRDRYGVFPLKGKVMNVKDTTAKRINENEEINHLKKILGLETNKKYDDVSALRYGRLMIMTDADVDGSHIKGLVFNLFHSMWPSLLKNGGFMCSMLTPIVKVTKGKAAHSFYHLGGFQEWMEANDQGRGWHIKYYKGLGTSTTKEAKDYFRDMRVVRYDWDDEGSNESLDLAFNKKRADDRKAWLGRYDREDHIDPVAFGEQRVRYETFVDKELIHFSNYNLERSIPSVCDGLKRSQRKILYCCLKRKLHQEIKVAQLAGYVSEHGAYHHGEASLHDAIVGMAQTFVGSNNLNLLEPNGQFGTRIQGGKDAASPRYIHTMLSPIVAKLFHADDTPVLTHLEDDGMPVEPMHYLPIVPVVLVNGALGIGTGFSTTVPCYDPRQVVRQVRHLLREEALEPMRPWYRDFKGRIQDGTSYGVFKAVNDTRAEVTELPIGYWTEDFKTNAEALMDKHPQAIKDLEAHYTERDVRFVVRFQSKAVAQEWLAPGEDGAPSRFESELKLRSTRGLSTTNMHLYDANGVIRRYESPEAILRDFFAARMVGYVERKRHLLTRLREDATVLRARIRFIMEIIDGTLKILNVPKKALVDALIEREYPTHEGDHEYLVRMPIQTLTLERKEELLKLCETKEAALADLEGTTETALWERDLDALEAAL